MLVAFDDLLHKTSKDSRRHVLLGNGFSIARFPEFHSKSLWQTIWPRLSAGDQAQLEHLQSESSEDALAAVQGQPRYAALQEHLIVAISQAHPAGAHLLPPADRALAAHFLENFDDIFTTNYDLLLYWVYMHGVDAREWGKRRRDGFYSNHPGQPLVFDQKLSNARRGLFYLHGAFHLYGLHRTAGKNRSAEGQTLIQQLRDNLANRRLPLVVTEGTPEQKLTKIQANDYLACCLRRLRIVTGTVFTFGFGFNSVDNHILRTLATNPGLRRLCIGVYPGRPGEPVSAEFLDAGNRLQTLRQEAGMPRLEVTFYASSTATVWQTQVASSTTVGKNRSHR